ncbi:HET-domain-containing protein [Xylariomycetidae sp. FL0641]|nr:HET-domain-containing protein [Xylariomycetidae sp. FL0641]
MRLLRTDVHGTKGLTLEYKNPHEMKGLQYAILSHTWAENELVFEDIVSGTGGQKPQASHYKVRKACEQARQDGYDYIWIDTCCIDKRSSAELSEAINSMFAWYHDAAICYAFLADVADEIATAEGRESFLGSKWFRRGWTLQELVAPKGIHFFSGGWAPIGEKAALSVLLSEITGVDLEILQNDRDLNTASIARRMSWAAKREVSRPEDMAYCLMGIFSVNMPMLYGEGREKAFLRLQEEIMKESDDQSLFAWVIDNSPPPDAIHGLLAPHPHCFLYSNSIIPYQDWEPRSPYTMTNRGLRIDLPLTALGEDMYVAALDCPSPPNFENSSFLAIYLRRLPESYEQYARVNVGTFAMVRNRGPIRTIYVRQKPHAPSGGGAYPKHILQLRELPSPSIYKVVEILLPANLEHRTEPLTTRTDVRAIVPLRWRIAFPTRRGASQLAAAIVFMRDDEEHVAVLIGSLKSFQVAFDALELGTRVSVSFEDLERDFRPSTSGRFELEYHSVRISATPVVQTSSKYYMIDIGLEVVKRHLGLSRIVEAYNSTTGSNLPGPAQLSPLETSVSDSRPQEEKGKVVEHKASSFWKRLRA